MRENAIGMGEGDAIRGGRFPSCIATVLWRDKSTTLATRTEQVARAVLFVFVTDALPSTARSIRANYGTAVPTNVVMLLAGNVYVNELEVTETLDCGARFNVAEVIVGVTLEKVGAFVRLNGCETADAE